MALEPVDDVLKVIVVGNGGVGKSSLLYRYCKEEFLTDYKKTIGVHFMEKDVYSKSTGDSVRMMLWDTAGQEVFNSLTTNYYRGAKGCILAFSTVDKESFQAIRQWKEQVEGVCGRGNVVLVLIQTKIDLIEKATVNNAEAEQLAKSLGVKFFRTSTKDNFNIQPVFEYLIETVINKGASGDGDFDPAMHINMGTKEGRDNPETADVGAPVATSGGGGGTTKSKPANDDPAAQPVQLVGDKRAKKKGLAQKLSRTCTIL